jgi:sodium/pantothenate symporter
MIVGGVSLITVILVEAGGFQNIFQSLGAAQSTNLTPPGANEFGTPGVIISFAIILGIMGIGQPTQILRLMSFKDSKSLHNAIIYATAIVFFWTVLLVFIGAIGPAFIPELQTPTQVIPQLLLGNFPPVIAGILVAAPAAAIMSSVDSYLHVVVTSLTRDLYINFWDENPSTQRLQRIVRYFGITIGLLSTAIALSLPQFISIFITAAWGGLGLFTFPFLIGIYWRKSNKYGAVAGIGGGLITYIILFSQFGSWAWFRIHSSVIALAVSLLLLVGVSYFTPNSPPAVLETFLMNLHLKDQLKALVHQLVHRLLSRLLIAANLQMKNILSMINNNILNCLVALNVLFCWLILRKYSARTV